MVRTVFRIIVSCIWSLLIRHQHSSTNSCSLAAHLYPEEIVSDDTLAA
jgi:hypothetical protein